MARNVAVRFTADTSDVDKGIAETEKKVGKLGETLGGLALAGGAIVGGALVAGLMDSLNVEKANAKLAAQLGDTKVSAAEAGKAAGAIYRRGWGDSIDQVNEAILQSSRNIGASSQAELENIAQKATIVSTTFDQDLGGVTAAVGQMLKNGLAPNADAAFDILTKGIQSGVDKSGDLLDTFNEYGTKFRDLGLSGQQMTGILSQGLQAGARDADTVADTFKELAITSINGSKTTEDAYKSLGINSKQMTADMAAGGERAAKGTDLIMDKLRAVKDPAEKSRIAVELFGTKAEDLGDALFAIDPSEATKGLGDFAGATDHAAETQSDALTQFETFKRQALGGISDIISGTVIPAFMQFVFWIQENGKTIGIVAGIIGAIFFPLMAKMAIEATISAVKQVGAWVMASGAAVAASVSYAFTFAAMVAGWVWAGIQSLIQAGRMALAWFIALGPVGWVIATVIALAALIIANWDWIRAKTIEIWTIVWNWVSDKFNWVVDNIFRPIGDTIKGIFTGIGTALNDLGAWFGRGVEAIGKKWNELKEIAAIPVRFLVNTVWNEGIRVAWNSVVGLFGGKQLDPVKLGFASGGGVYGRGTGTSDSIPAMLSAGEHIWTAEEVRGAGGHDRVAAMREAVRHGSIGLYRGGGPVGPPVAGGGLVWQTLWNIISHQFPGARLTSSVRNEPGSYHNVGKAIDIAGSRSMDMPFMLMVDQWIGQNYPNSTELIHTDRGAINLWHGMPHTYNAKTQSDHINHVHWAMESLTGNLAGGVVGQTVRDFIGQITDAFKNPFGLVDKLLGDFGGTGWGKGIGDMAKSTVDKLFGSAKDQAGKAQAASATMGATSNEAPGIVRIISDVARSRFGALARRAAVVGVATGIVESGLRNLNYGDRDSIGVFQQRPSQGWGSVSEIMNVSYAAGKFFSRFPGNWALMNQGALAQSVQRSAFPGRYQTQMGNAEGLVTQYGGFDNGGLLMPGMTLAYNGTGKPEMVTPMGGGAVRHYHLTIIDAANGRIDLEQQFRRMEILGGVA